MTRRDIEFDAEGVILRGWFYTANSDAATAPVIVMAHGLSAVKEMYLDDYAEHFSGAGLHVLVFDHRNFGASDGEPRQEIDPVAQTRDYRHAITYAKTLPEVDGEKIGIWGSSFSGGHVQVVAAYDKRVKAAVAQVPFVSGIRQRASARPARVGDAAVHGGVGVVQPGPQGACAGVAERDHAPQRGAGGGV